MKILFGLTGSVAAILCNKLQTKLSEIGEVKTVLTPAAEKIIYNHYTQSHYYYTEKKEWEWKTIGDSVHHVELAEWADIFVIAPLSANTLAKMANGICDNMLTCIYRCYDINKPIIVAPAMNTKMWEHPITNKHITVLEQLHNFRILNAKFVIVPPIEKQLACGTIGMGAMANIDDIVKVVEKFKK